MALISGVDPLLVITLKNKGIQNFFGPASASTLSSIVNAIGLPIPIYLSEKPGGGASNVQLVNGLPATSGIFVDTESSAIDVNTKSDGLNEKGLDGQVKPPEVSQTIADSQVTINMFAKKGSILLALCLSLMDLIVNRLVSGEYDIHYLNGPTAIFGAKLHRFSKSISSGTDLVTMELTLSTAAKTAPTPKAAVDQVPATPGTRLGPTAAAS